MIRSITCSLLLVISTLAPRWATAADWTIPIAGNTFRLEPAEEGRRGGFQRDGSIRLAKPSDRFVAFFRVDRPTPFQLSARVRSTKDAGTVQLKVLDRSFSLKSDGKEYVTTPVGELVAEKPGYIRIEIAGEEGDGLEGVEIQELQVSSQTEGLVVDFVRSNDGNMFYWGRRGPSVHLNYETPKNVSLQYAYSEITVPVGMDVEGSYFMANGFSEGYFGFQVNAPKERRVLFSVWSPFKTDNPKEIPEEQRIQKLASGPDVRIGEFGNEGSGGQSYLIYPWQAGATYRFLTEVKPDPNSTEHTLYTAWFGDKAQNEWRLIASFRRPKTSTYLRGFHSFLENFNPQFGHLARGADYGNVWVVDTEGKWYECSRARLSADATARGRHRLDFDGGARGNHFFMQNCGFFDQTGRVGEFFSRDSTASDKPEIDFASLPK
ncbi:DUF3472 domain-containing protein [Pirellulaceae bacterium SH467]